MQLTLRQAQVIAAIRVTRQLQGYSPSIAELAAQLHLARGTITGHLRRLERKRLIRTTRGVHRSTEICDDKIRESTKISA